MQTKLALKRLVQDLVGNETALEGWKGDGASVGVDATEGFLSSKTFRGGVSAGPSSPQRSTSMGHPKEMEIERDISGVIGEGTVEVAGESPGYFRRGLDKVADEVLEGDLVVDDFRGERRRGDLWNGLGT